MHRFSSTLLILSLLLATAALPARADEPAADTGSAEGGPGVKSTLKGTGREMKEDIKDFGHGMKGAGKEVGQGVKKGAHEVKDTAKGLWNRVTD